MKNKMLKMWPWEAVELRKTSFYNHQHLSDFNNSWSIKPHRVAPETDPRAVQTDGKVSCNHGGPVKMKRRNDSRKKRKQKMWLDSVTAQSQLSILQEDQTRFSSEPSPLSWPAASDNGCLWGRTVKQPPRRGTMDRRASRPLGAFHCSWVLNEEEI